MTQSISLHRRHAAIALGASLIALTAAFGANAQSAGKVVKIGIIADQSGPYADNGGPGSVAAARLAIDDWKNTVAGMKIELVVADDQNKPDVGVATAKRWIEQDGVDVIVGGSASSIALATQEVMKKANKPYLLAGTASSDLTNGACSPMGQQWVLDTYSLPKATAKALVTHGSSSPLIMRSARPGRQTPPNLSPMPVVRLWARFCTR
jgi:branched-chain amino acid transport system substrate-binding protein